MPKKKAPKLEKQLNVRVSANIYDRVEETAHKLGIDPSDLVRMLLAEKLPEYEERARKTHPPADQPLPDSRDSSRGDLPKPGL